MAWGHEMIGQVSQALAKGEDVDFEAENQAMSDKVKRQTSSWKGSLGCQQSHGQPFLTE